MVTIAIEWFEFSQNLLSFPTLWLVIAGLIFPVYVWMLPPALIVSRKLWPAGLFALGAIFLVPFIFLWETFGTADFGSLLTSIYENPPQELLSVGLGSLGQPILEHTLILIVIIVGGIVFTRRVPYFGYCAVAISIPFFVASPVTEYAYRYFVPNPHHALLNLDEDLTPPMIIERPSQPKNVIYIYLESIERTYRDVEATADAFAPLAELEDKGLSFDQLFTAYGLHFTAGGMIGTQCGVPLLPNGIRNVRKQIREGTDNEVLQFEGFMDNVVCLGDILAEDGYIGSYMNGSDLAVFSKGKIFQSHGWERVFGVNSLPGSRAETYENVWGLNDDTLFEYAKTELEYLVGTDRPFMMAMLTISTHGPDAELDEGCDYPQVADSYIPAAIYCTGQHVNRLLDKLDELGVRDDTIVVVLSDHLSMRNTVWDQLRSAGNARRNYAVVLGAGESGVVSKVGNGMDLYPTVLELLGYRLKDGRANMGVSLLNDRPTLAGRSEEPQDVSRMVKQNRPLQDLLWNDVIN